MKTCEHSGAEIPISTTSDSLTIMIKEVRQFERDQFCLFLQSLISDGIPSTRQWMTMEKRIVEKIKELKE